jgi:hypothetical protein
MVALVVSGAARAAEPGNRPEYVVPVYVENGNEIPVVISQAEILAARLFRTAGVEIHWTSGVHSRPKGPGVIIVSLGAASRSDPSGALAAARPYEGIHIEVFYDRVKAVPTSLQPTLLAHVLVHEITHVLQGVSCHAPTGIMKARWDDADFSAMLWKSLPFTSQGIELIHLGLEKRASRAAAAALVSPR